MENTERCPWCGDDPLYVHYHDTVWGRPEFDDLALFVNTADHGSLSAAARKLDV